MPKMTPSGDLDRRIKIQRSVTTRDSSGDEVHAWENAFKLWAKRTIPMGVTAPGHENANADAVLRQSDTNWEVRYGFLALSIAPESHRVVYQDRVYEIVGIREGRGRQNRIVILTSARPDGRGPRGSGDVSE